VRLSPGTRERRDASEATPVNFEASERAIASLSLPVPSDFPADVSSFFASLPSSHDSFSFSNKEKTRESERESEARQSYVLPLSFRENCSIRRLTLFSLSLSSAFPSTVTPLERRSLNDPSICSVWQSTTKIHCHRSTSTPRSVYTPQRQCQRTRLLLKLMR